MRLGDRANAEAEAWGKPLDGVRILAAEQMQALPFATQLLARLGAEVVKVEHPVHGESGRGARPAMVDPQGRAVGATFLRNNLGKRSIGIDLKTAEGRDLFAALVPHFDVVAENFKPGTMERLGLGYHDLAERFPRMIYVSISGFGQDLAAGAVEQQADVSADVSADGSPGASTTGAGGVSPYRSWPAYAPIVEAMSGIYDYKREPGRPPVVAPVGALGDIGTALFGVIGVLAALRHRDQTGQGQLVDVAMYDAMVAMTDLVTNFWSMGLRPDGAGFPMIMDAFEAADGWFVVQVGREHQFARLAEVIGHPEWVGDPRFADRAGWRTHLETAIRPAVERWASNLTRRAACEELGAAGVAAGPCHTAVDVIDDPHVAQRNMLVEMPRTDGVVEPVLVPGNPIKLSKMTEGPEVRVPWVGEHTDAVLTTELGLDPDELARLRAQGVIS